MSSEIRIKVGSQNPVKVNAAKAGFACCFPSHVIDAQGAAVPSGVSDQPMSDEETLRGATNRAQLLRDDNSIDFAVGIEGGIVTIEEQLFAAAWVVVIDQNGSIGRSRSGTFALPPRVKALVDSGMELGLANDEVFNQVNSKHAGGAVGSLTGGLIDRQALYEHAMILALIRFTQPELFNHAD
ncbi:MAG: DUF84 family protein [Aureliella sp.]